MGATKGRGKKGYGKVVKSTGAGKAKGKGKKGKGKKGKGKKEKGKGKKDKPKSSEELDKELDEFMGPDAKKKNLDSELESYFKS